MIKNETKNNFISVVLGSKNRKKLLIATIDSIRNNGFDGSMEIIVIDGGSTDGTCDWLAQQKDIFTIIQPNYKKIDEEGISVLENSWGNFMNIAFRFARAKWIVMLSDDLLLEKGCLQKGYDELEARLASGEKIGGGAFFFREYPRMDYYRVICLPGDVININHGFYNKEALELVNYLDEKTYNFYYADGDVSLRISQKGWKILPLEKCFADHLVHLPSFKKISDATVRDMNEFDKLYPQKPKIDEIKIYKKIKINRVFFWKYSFWNCFFGYLLKIYDKNK